MRHVLTLGVATALFAVAVAACASGDAKTFESADQVGAWVESRTGECDTPRRGTIEEFAEFVGPLRAKLYAPFVAEWATCAKAPYEKLGLVVFKQGGLAALQESWKSALASGEIPDDPDFGFGAGFALTGSIGMENLGLRHLRCTPVETTDIAPVPADAPGCFYTAMSDQHHHH